MFRIFLSLLSCFFFLSGLNAQVLEPFYEEMMPSDWTRPVGVAFDEKGRGYVWEQRGRIYLLDEEGAKIPTPLIDISEEISNWSDHGLLGFVLHPHFYENGHFYLLYIVDRHYLFNYGTPDYNEDVMITNEATIGRITRFTADANNDFKTTLPESRKVILGKTVADGFPVLMGSHGVGTLLFGQDGTLLASCGEAASYQSSDAGSAEETYFAQALDDGILRPEENIGSYRAQMIDCLAGKIIRIDAETGEGLPSNPFYDAAAPDSDRSKVWTLGMRNPFKVVLKPNTGSHNPADGNPGHLFVGDVGANLWEETSVVKEGGSNLGWPIYEAYRPKWPFHWDKVPNMAAPNPMYGTSCDLEFFTYENLIVEAQQDTIIAPMNPCNEQIEIPNEIPIFVHNRPIMAWSNRTWNQPTRAMTSSFDADGMPSMIELDSTLSVVEGQNFDGYSSLPGFFYEGENVPEDWRGKFFNADYAGWIKVWDLDEDYNVQKEISIHDACKDIVSLAYNSTNGDIYYTNIATQKLMRITYGGTPPPVALATADKDYGLSPLEVNFLGEESYSPYDSPLTYHWDFGDENSSTEINPSHTFVSDDNGPQAFTVQLTVSDTSGLSRTTDLVVSVNNTPPDVRITSFEDGDFYPINGTTYLPLEAAVSDAEHSADALTYQWITYLHHNEHFHPEPIDNQVSSYTVIDPVGCNGELFWYRIELTVTDGHGLSTVVKSEIFPYCGDDFTKIVDLEGEATETNVKLAWVTNFENEVVNFEVQRSSNISDFRTIGTIENNPTAIYQFIDENPIFGINNYRIKAVNSEGIYLYSNELLVSFPPEKAFRLYPNPANDFVIVELLEPATEVLFEVFDGSGRLLLNYNWDSFHITPDERFDRKYSLTNFSDGIYFYRLISGEQIYTGRFIVAK